MNHLAHVHLSGSNPELLLGNLATDYLRKKDCLELPLPLQRGVALHRHIDHTIDNHPDVRACWTLLHPKHGKYASVIFDIYCDYLLTKDWSKYDDRPLSQVAQFAYAAIQQEGGALPESLAQRFHRMAAADWLISYGSYAAQRAVFARFAKRVSRPELIDGVVDSLQQHEQRFAEAFSSFYPFMQQSCTRWIAKHPSSEYGE